MSETREEIEALEVAVRALRWYANADHWHKDDWGIQAVIASPDYSHERAGGQKARNALMRIEQMRRGAHRESAASGQQRQNEDV